jgi:hypothetical protein
MMVSETAFHEAAHAVVAADLRVPFTYVTAVAGPKHGGKLEGGLFKLRLFVSNRRGGFRRRSAEELRKMARERLPRHAVVALAARALCSSMEFRTASGRRLPPSKLGYDGDEKIVKDVARQLGIKGFAAWREQMLDHARDIVALPHVARAVQWVARNLETECQIHAMKRGTGRLSAKDVRWILCAASGLESGRKKAA